MAVVTKKRRRAHRLLMDNLTGGQRKTFLRHGYFDVQAMRLYRIHYGLYGNIEMLDTRWPFRYLWLIPSDTDEEFTRYVVEDVLLAQKVWLESKEREALRTACRPGQVDRRTRPPLR